MPSVLVDTSVWVRFLANRDPYADALDHILAREQVYSHPMIYGELLMGDSGGRRQFLRDYQEMSPASLVAHWEVVDFVNLRRLNGRGIGWIDVHLLASAIVDRLQLWTADARLATVAEELGIAYSIPVQDQ